MVEDCIFGALQAAGGAIVKKSGERVVRDLTRKLMFVNLSGHDVHLSLKKYSRCRDRVDMDMAHNTMEM